MKLLRSFKTWCFRPCETDWILSRAICRLYSSTSTASWRTDRSTWAATVVSFYSRFIYTLLNFGGPLEGCLFLISNVSELHCGRCRTEPRRISFKFPNSMKEPSKRWNTCCDVSSLSCGNSFNRRRLVDKSCQEGMFKHSLTPSCLTLSLFSLFFKHLPRQSNQKSEYFCLLWSAFVSSLGFICCCCYCSWKRCCYKLT